MANERGFGKGIIRLEGPALVRPEESSLVGGLTPAALEMVTGIRCAAAHSLKHQLLRPDVSRLVHLPQVPKNYVDDWWGE